jgi:hypothetical protein
MNGTSNTIAIIVEGEVATPEDYGAHGAARRSL